MKYIPLALILLLSFAANCQKSEDIPAFGKVDKAELEMNSCDFDKDAEAMVLFDVERVGCNLYAYSVDTKAERHVRIKILNDKGLDQANIKIPYLSIGNSEAVNGIQAQTYNLDASGRVVVTKLDKKSIYAKAINKRISEKIFSFPDVKPGCIIEYSYTVDADLEASIKNWEFQRSIPVKLSRYTIDFPSEIEVYCDPVCTLPFESHMDGNLNRNIKTYTMTNIPALRDEPYISCQDDYLQRLEPDIVAVTVGFRRINLRDSWGDIVQSLMADNDFGQQLSKTIPHTADLDQELGKMTDPYLKMTTIYRYVRKNMEWNGYDNIWALNGVKSAWKEKKGTSGEINLILVNLLKDAGLDAHAILVSTVENGKINTTHPSYSQFNKVMAYLTIDKKVYILDATNKYASPKLTPWEVMASEGLVIGNKNESTAWAWKTIWDATQKFRDDVVVNGSIDEKGNLSGYATVRSYDYSRTERLPELKNGKDKFIGKYFMPSGSGIRIDSFTTENEETDTLPLVQEFHFSQPLNSSGGYSYFSTNLFAGLEKNPFIADTRFSDIFFGAGREYSILGTFTIPDGYSFEELPKNLRMRLPDTSVVFTRILQADGNLLSASMKLEFKKPMFTVDEYDDFREFYKKLFGLLTEQIIIKKNPGSSAQKN